MGLDFTQRWLIMLAIATILFAISFLILRINIRTLVIFFVIGISAVTLWMIVDAKYFSGAKKNILAQRCSCPICRHEHAGACVQNKCACCLLTKGEKVIGHSSGALQ